MLFVVAEIYCDRDHGTSKINFINETFKVLHMKDFKVVRIKIISDKRIYFLVLNYFLINIALFIIFVNISEVFAVDIVFIKHSIYVLCINIQEVSTCTSNTSKYNIRR